MNAKPSSSSRTSKSSASLVFWWLIGLLPVGLIVFGWFAPGQFDASQTEWRRFIEQFGKAGVLAFVLLQAIQVVVTPLNHYVIGLLGGFLYGPILGGLANYIGRVIGHVVAFGLTRRYGRPFAQRWVTPESIAKYDRLVGNRPNVAFLIYFLPFFPDDEISYLLGLSKMSFRNFLTAAMFGHVGGSWSLAYVGAGVQSYDWVFWLLVAATIAGFPVIVWLLRRDAAHQPALPKKS